MGAHEQGGMPTMAAMIDEILSQISDEQLSAALGTDEDTAVKAARAALPTLIGAMAGNAEDPAELMSLQNALLEDHDGSLLDADNPLAAVDMSDGSKILSHVFGDQRPQVEQRLGGVAGGTGVISKLLPMLAPLVMAWLSRKLAGSLGGGQTAPAPDTGGGLGDILGDILGGDNKPEATPRGSGGLGDILGDILGGERDSAKSSMPDLGDLFDMFGKGAKKPSGGNSNVPDVGDIFGS